MLETQRLIIREFTVDDVKDLIAIASQPHVKHWLPDWKGVESWAALWIEKVQRQYKTDNPEKEFLALAVDLKATHQLIGKIGIGGCDQGIGICYFMSESFTKKGYATEAVQSLIDYTFKKYKYDHLIATVQPDNIASNRVVKKLGFTYLSTIEMLDNGQTDVLPFHLYQLNNPYLPAAPVEEIANCFSTSHIHHLLDLGCGTGIELERLFKKYPDLSVTGVDLSQEMLHVLKQKYADKNLNLICASYFDADLGQNTYEGILSTYSLHHFSEKMKAALYKKIYEALTDGGIYVEGDYTVKTMEQQNFYLSENERLKKENVIKDGFYHYDMPFTVQTQIKLLKAAGFTKTEVVKEWENTSIIAAKK